MRNLGAYLVPRTRRLKARKEVERMWKIAKNKGSRYSLKDQV